MQSKSVLENFYRTAALHDGPPSNSILTSKRGGLNRKISKSKLEAKLTSKLEKGWQSSQNTNLGGFSLQMSSMQDHKRKLKLERSLVKLQSLKQLDTAKKVKKATRLNSTHLLKNSNSPEMRRSQEMLRNYINKFDPLPNL